MTPRIAWAGIALLAAAGRFSQAPVVWVEEAYPMAGALEMLAGKVPYRDFWFDKPPLTPLLYAMVNPSPGFELRLFGVGFVLLCCWLASRVANALWGRVEGLWAAAFTAFYLTFAPPASSMAIAPDLLMLAPHLAAVWLAIRSRPLAAGIMCGLAFGINPKALIVVAVCLLWLWRRPVLFGAGFVATTAIILGWLGAINALPAYWQQVWEWGRLYSAEQLAGVGEGVVRSLRWAAYHSPLVIGAVVVARRERHWRLWIWVAVSFAAVWLGWRFFPRYYVQLLAPLIVLGSRGITLLPARTRVAVLLLCLVPAVRFGPDLVRVATATPWQDLALHDDAREVARLLKQQGAKNMLVWGYRPEVIAYSRVPLATPFLDSQPLTGVIADRHLSSSHVSAPEIAASNRRQLVAYTPEFIVDGLGPLNGDLGIDKYADLAAWLSRYEVAARTRYSVIYRLKPVSSLNASRVL